MVQQKDNLLSRLFQEKGQLKSYFFMIVSSFSWVYGYVYANQHNFTPIETNLSRSLIMTIGSFFICRLMGLNIEFRSPQSWKTLLRRHLSFIVQGLTVAGVQFYLPLGAAHTICAAGPIFTLLMQRIIRKSQASQISGQKLQGCLISVIGILLTSNGKFIYGYLDKDFQFNTGFQNYASSSFEVMTLATVILLLSMLAWSYGVLITQQAECHSFEIVFHFAVMNLLFSSIAYMFLPDKRPASEMYQSLIWIGIFLLFAQICFTSALNLAENIALTNITAFFVVVVGYGISIFRYGETVDIISLLGTLFVLLGVSFVILTKDKKSQQSISSKSNQLNQTLTYQQLQQK